MRDGMAASADMRTGSGASSGETGGLRSMEGRVGGGGERGECASGTASDRMSAERRGDGRSTDTRGRCMISAE